MEYMHRPVELERDGSERMASGKQEDGVERKMVYKIFAGKTQIAICSREDR